ncbi:hypothetical protein A2480_03985 [Candidatus Uhrbacteria bacterium RIFOXYC2_FULL_47_19]|uniref:Uncharacterized protein n=1 Tax=Candidatus Uhrbacteria bacterium RIFOXYC2_FULL_47_19 TaxID=1802424 RepID=A0A1F7WC27_9BACT|nr:MAG: hypothetical protein A2480_03985 [Candidatus Uhrbacteria bacterium RIFOXYC2_FULL_47_19]
MYTSKEYAEALYSGVRGLKDKEATVSIKRFVGKLKDRGLIALLPLILRGLPAAARKLDGIEEVTVESAHELNSELADRAVGLIGGDRNQSEVTMHVNPDLLGGIRVRGRDTVYDATLKNHLVTLKEKFVRSS